MSTHTKKMRENLARLATDLRAIVAKAKADNDRGLTAEEREKFHNIEADYTALEQSIKNSERIDEIEGDLRTVDRDRITAVMGDEVYGAEAKKENDKKHSDIFSLFLKHGKEGLTPEQQHFMAQRYVGGNGKAPNTIKAAQTLTTTGGGYLVPQGFSGQLEDAMKWYGGILGNVGEFTTETGNPMPWPTDNDTTNMGTIIGVNVQLSEVDVVFGQITFSAYIFSSNSILVPLALVEDSYFNIDQFLVKKLGQRLGRAVNHYCTVGTGSNQPYGIVPAAVAAGNTVTFATGSTTSVGYSDLVNVLHAVDPAYRNMPSAKWEFADTTLKALRKMVDGNNRPLWQPGLTAGFGQAFPETILDKPYAINQDMATMAANADSILFGDLSKYMVRKVASGTTIMRLVERYADYLQVGYLGFLRLDGQLLDAGTHPIAVGINSAT